MQGWGFVNLPSLLYDTKGVVHTHYVNAWISDASTKHMSPAPSRSLLLQCVKPGDVPNPPPSNVLEICNVVIFNFYRGLPYRRSLQGEKLQNSSMCLHMQILIWLPAAHADPVKPGPPKIWSSKETYCEFYVLRSLTGAAFIYPGLFLTLVGLCG